MRAFRTLLLGLGAAAIWPAYLGLWPTRRGRRPGRGASRSAAPRSWRCLALAAFVAGLARWLFRPGGWAEIDAAACRRRWPASSWPRCWSLVLAGVVLAPPRDAAERGPDRPGGPAGLGPGARASSWSSASSSPSGGSPSGSSAAARRWSQWLSRAPRAARLAQPAPPPGGRLGARRDRRSSSSSTRAATASRRVGWRSGPGRRWSCSAFCCGPLPDDPPGDRPPRLALDPRRAMRRHGYAGGEATDASGQPDDLADRLRRLAGYLVPLLGVFLAAWIWNVDLALFRFLGEQPLWLVDAKTDDLRDGRRRRPRPRSSWLITTAAWRHLSTLFAVAVFPRMPDDPGMRFAVVTLCRYAVLGVGLLAGLSAIHLGPDKIGMVLAALGVGLGLRPPGDRLELRLRDHPAARAADPRRRHRDRLGDDRQGRSDQHPRHHDHQRRQPEHHRPEPRVHHGRPDQLDAQGQGHPRLDPAEGGPRDRPRPRLATCSWASRARTPTCSATRCRPRSWKTSATRP